MYNVYFIFLLPLHWHLSTDSRLCGCKGRKNINILPTLNGKMLPRVAQLRMFNKFVCNINF